MFYSTFMDLVNQALKKTVTEMKLRETSESTLIVA